MSLRALDDARKQFLRLHDSVDVSACPGSGKTTLVVAKLAILARSWESRTQGICVLSHTNVAREEIQRRLGETDVGDRLLGYPHYIDTIHGFVNRYLAVPWLQANGHQLTVIDDELTARMRRRALGNDWRNIEYFLGKRNIDFSSLRLTSADLSNPLANWNVNLSRTSSTFVSLSSAMQKVAEDGYFRFDEMLLFGQELLKRKPDATAALRQRFPFVLVDEMQDTTSEQHGILDRLFPHDSPGTTIQRVGDINQAIFAGETTSEHAFPDPSRSRIEVFDSFRFDNSIASLFSNFATTPTSSGVIRGIGESIPALPDGRHTVFVFPRDDTSEVFPAFARTVLGLLRPEHFESLRIAAVGAVHKDKQDVAPADKKYPNTISHYWSGYIPQASGKSYQPSAMVDCLRSAQASVAAMANPLVAGITGLTDGTTASAVNSAAAAMIRLVNLCSPTPHFRLRSRPHRFLEQYLVDYPRSREIYRSVLARFVLGSEDLTEDVWKGLIPELQAFAKDCLPVPDVAATQQFLAWTPPPVKPSAVTAVPANSLQLQADADVVQIDLSSIHAVKGETHAATLVLETYQNAHFFKSLMPWLIGDRVDAKGCNQLQLRRLRAAYVAMSRPAHLLCLAIPFSSLGEGNEHASNLEKLKARGWRIEDLNTAVS